MWNYNNYKQWLYDRLAEIKNDLGFQDYTVEVFNEQDYAKRGSIRRNTISVITKFLQSSMVFGAKTQPIQMIVIAEQNGIGVANSILTRFSETYNMVVTTEGDTYIKHNYSTPSVLTNFVLVGVGERTVLYLGANLIIMDRVMDVDQLKVSLDKTSFGTYESQNTYNKGDIVVYNNFMYECLEDDVDGEWDSTKWKSISTIALDPISATIGYTMVGDSQPVSSSYYTKTEKNYATLVMTITVACTETPFTQACLRILNKESLAKGNDKFDFDFYIGKFRFTLTMVMQGCTFTTAKNNVPSIQMSFNV